MNRLDLLKKLNAVSVGLSKKELLEQSNSFIFAGKQVIAFNGEIMCRAKNPFDFDAVVRAEELVKLLTRMNDEEIKVSLKESEIVVKGKGKAAGISCEAEVLLPYKVVPKPGTYSPIDKGVSKILQQAAMTCGIDESMPKTTCVHVEKNRIEACDNFRMYRCKIKTGFPIEVLIPAGSLKAVKAHKMKAVSSSKEWIHFKTDAGCIVSIRCYADKYHDGLDALLEVEGSKIELPAELGEILERAEVMLEAGYEAEVGLSIENNVLIINSSKDGGWYKEKKKIKYKGKPLSFKINPEFLVEILEKTRTVVVGNGRMKIKTDNVEFMVSLEV